jgi:phosphotransacetylase
MNQPIEVLVNSVTARGIVNVTAAAVAQANG